jgi:RNA polymerase primary sigma factor
MKTRDFKNNSNVVRNETLNAYLSAMSKFKQLSDNEVRDLIMKAQNGSIISRNKVVESNLRIVWSIAAKYQGMDVFEDVIQNGNIGLIKAVETFDVSRETSFSTWALEYVRKFINIGLTNESRCVRKGAHQIGDDYAVSSLDAPIGNEEGEEKTMLDFMPSDMQTDNFSDVEHLRAQIEYLMSGLKDKEKEIVCKLFGFGCREYTQLEVSMEYHCTEERVRQIKFESLAKMKAMSK